MKDIESGDKELIGGFKNQNKDPFIYTGVKGTSIGIKYASKRL